MTKNSAPTHVSAPSSLPSDACPDCGTPTLPASATMALPVHGEEIRVPRVAHSVCPNCGEKLLDAAQALDLQRRAFDRYRRKYGLLEASDIRALREQLRLSQSQLASLLRLGAVTLSRWESGRYVQTASMDVLLRLIRDVPATVSYLKKAAA